jgi:TPR repeat protein
VSESKEKIEAWASYGDDYYYGLNGQDVDYERALHFYLKAAKNEHPHATYMAALCYELGRGTDEYCGTDEYLWQAKNLYELAKSYGDEDAIVRLRTGKPFEPPPPVEDAKAAKGAGGDSITDPKKQNEMGDRYCDGKDGFEQDFEKAAHWFKKAAAQGFAEAQHNLGWCYQEGKGVRQDWQIAASWYEKAAAQGFAKSQRNLGICYEDGEGVRKDLKKAMQLYAQAAAHNEREAQYRLGASFYAGEIVEEDLEKAAHWVGKAALQGHVNAQHLLGVMYGNGEGVKQDFDASRKWLKKAIDNGSELAAEALATLEGEAAKEKIGDDLARGNRAYAAGDFGAAVKFFQRAADEGNAGAQFRLGVCYARGEGVRQNLKTAIIWTEKAAKKGDSEAIETLPTLYSLFGIEHFQRKNYDESFRYHKIAAANDRHYSQLMLGIMYVGGLGVAQDLNQAKVWFYKAASENNPDKDIRKAALEHLNKIK